MTRKQKVLTGAAVVILLGSAASLSLARGRERGVDVRLEEIGRRTLVESITASGNIRARRTVSISSDVSARVAQLAVKEGDEVRPGQVLLRLDPGLFDAAVARAQAALSQARAQESSQRASLLRAERDLDDLLALHARDSVLVSRQQIADGRTALAIATANLEASAFGVQQALASLDEARDRLSKTVIRAPMAGKITRLSIEEGETVMVGTMNNPGSVLLTISDLSVVEVVVQVDETEVPGLSLGDSAAVQIDAFPNVAFPGRITEIGQSAVRPPSSAAAAGQQSAVDFQVVITLDDVTVALRPDLSATAEIVRDIRPDAIAVPIIALTIRDAAAAAEAEEAPEEDRSAGKDGEDQGKAPSSDGATADVEGVFVVRGGRVTFTPVALGISGQEYFEVASGLQVGDTVVAGPYQTIRALKTGDLVRNTGGVAANRPSPAG